MMMSAARFAAFLAAVTLAPLAHAGLGIGFPGEVEIDSTYGVQVPVPGNVPAIADGPLRVANAGGSETRAIYEFALPTLPDNAFYGSLIFNYRVSAVGAGAPTLAINAFDGNGRYDYFPTSDAVRGTFVGSSGPIAAPGVYHQDLSFNAINGRYTPSKQPWVGINVRQPTSGAAAVDLSGASLSYYASVPNKGTLHTLPSIDISPTGNDADGFDASENTTSIVVDERGATKRRGVLEYNLAGLPGGSKITGATLTLSLVGTNTPLGTAGPGVYAYVGNGRANAGDGVTTIPDAQRLDALAGVGAATTGSQDYSIALDPAVLQRTFDQGAFLGLALRGTSTTSAFSFASIDGSDPSSAARLTLTYDVPEPSTLAAVCGLTAIALRRRRSR